MIITQILQNTETGLWAIVETSDENDNYFIIEGGKEFNTEAEARDFYKTLYPMPEIKCKKVITTSLLYELIKQYNAGEISISRFAEILNELKTK